MTRTASLLLNVEMKFLIRQVLHIIQSRRTIRFHVSPYPTMQIFSGATGGHPVEDRTCSAWLGQRSPHHSRPQTHGSMECSLRMSCEDCRVCWTRGLARSALRPQSQLDPLRVPASATQHALVLSGTEVIASPESAIEHAAGGHLPIGSAGLGSERGWRRDLAVASSHRVFPAR